MFAADAEPFKKKGKLSEQDARAVSKKKYFKR